MRFVAAAIILAGLAATSADAQEPKRVASANLCADQLLLALANPDQIASLSPLARDASISFMAVEALKFPSNRASGEDLLKANADLVLIGAYDNRYTREILEIQKISTEVLTPWTDLQMGAAQIRRLAARLNQPRNGEALVRAIQNSIFKLPRVLGTEKPSFLTLHRRGFVHHAGLTSEILIRAGFRDASSDMGIGDYGFVSVERLVNSPPDFLVVDDEFSTPEDNGQAFLLHPALLKLWPYSRRIITPGRFTICGGPSTPLLIDALTHQIEEKVLPPRR